MIIRISSILTIFLILLSSIDLTAQEDFIPTYKNITIEDGLPTNIVYSVFIDHEGFVWFGTDQGAVKYNGYRYVNITTEDGLPSNSVFGFYQDNKDRIWFRTFSDQLSYYKNDSIFKPSVNDTLSELIKGRIIVSLKVINDSIYFGTIGGMDSKDGGVFEGDLNQITGFVPSLDVVGDTPLNVFEIDYLNYVYGTYNVSRKNKGLSLPKTKSVTFYGDSSTSTVVLNTTSQGVGHVEALKDIKGNYAITLGSKLYVLNKQNILDVFSLESTIQCLSLYKDGFLAGSKDGDVLYVRPINKNNYKQVFHIKLDGEITSVREGENGVFWVSTLDKGVYIIPDYKVQSITFNEIPTAIVSNEDQVYVGFIDGTIKSFGDSLEKVYQSFSPRQKVLTIQSLSKLNDNDILVGINQSGCNVISNDSLYFKKLSAIGNIYSYASDKNGEEWYGNHEGFFEFLNDNNVFISYNIGFAERVKSICKNGNNLWIGTKNGLWKYDGNNVGQAFPETVLSQSEISKIDWDEINKVLLVSTTSNGLFIINNNDIFQFSSANDLSSNVVNKFIIDGNNLWLATSKGLNLIENYNDEYKVFHFGQDQGLLSNSINDIIKFNGFIWMISDIGLTKMPSGKRPLVKVPQPYFTTFKVNEINKKLSNIFNLNYDQNNLFIEFFNKSYIENSLFEYQLVGVDPQPIVISDNSVRYPALLPGNYQFKVRSISDTDEKSDWKTLDIIITKPIWKEWYFYVIIVVLIVLLGFVVVNRRLRNLNHKLLLQKKLNELERQALQSQMNPHFIFNSLNSIQSFIASNSKIESMKYLSTFAQLMRLVLVSTREEGIPLSDEIKALESYMSLEQLRSDNKFSFSVNIKGDIETDFITIPSMIIQPYIENAIIHGVLNKDGEGHISIDFDLKEESVLCVIEDNGIGRERSKNIKREKNIEHKSYGILISTERLDLLNRNFTNKSVTVIDLYDADGVPSGTRVELIIPVLK